MEEQEVIQKFDDAMMGIYHRALKEANYRANIFFDMLSKHKGLETAKRLIHATNVSSGYTALWERNRLDLTVEALIVEHKEWHQLFSEEELQVCINRLNRYEYKSKLLT